MGRSFSSTAALVLHVRDSKEADRLVTLLCPEHGRITLAAKGVRKLTSRRSGLLNPGNIIRCSWVSSGEWHTLTEVVAQETLLTTSPDLQRLRDFTGILEMSYYLGLEGIEQELLYERMVSLLRYIGSSPEYHRGLVRQQLLELAEELGVAEASTNQNGVPTASVTQIFEEAFDRPLRSFSFLQAGE